MIMLSVEAQIGTFGLLLRGVRFNEAHPLNWKQTWPSRNAQRKVTI